ncbi:MAG: hypothetical protein ACQEWF_23340 [Bacillota bacterium]
MINSKQKLSSSDEDQENMKVKDLEKVQVKKGIKNSIEKQMKGGFEGKSYFFST